MTEYFTAMQSLIALANAAPVQPVRLPELERARVELAVWRLDRIDACASGNKLFKLEENLRAARAAGHRRLLSFGGAFSNHIHALALRGAAAGFETVGVIRGEATAAANPTLSDARAAGMMLHFVSREWYRGRNGDGARAELERRFGPCHVIPEGGANRAGTLGCRALGAAVAGWPQAPRDRAWAPRVDAPPSPWPALPDVVALPCGTGTTLAGLVAGLDNRCAALGIAVLKGGAFLNDAVSAQLRDIGAPVGGQWRIDTRHHGGGYARVSAQLMRFIADFERRTAIALEPVYSGKLFYALWRGIEAGEFAPGTRLLAVHTGGLQGARGFDPRAAGGAEGRPLRPPARAFSVIGSRSDGS